MKVNKALIFGGTGQDGILLNNLLLQNSYTVLSTKYKSELNTSSLKYLKLQIPHFISLDVTNFNQVKNLILDFNPTEIYNLAGQSSVYESFRNPDRTMKINFDGLLNIIQVIEKYDKAIKLFQASSSEMFGEQNRQPFSEIDSYAPTSPYGISKVCAHVVSEYYRKCKNLKIYSGILFNHESELRSTNFVFRKLTSSLSSIKAGKLKKVLVGNLEVARDWGYAGEYVQAINLLMKSDEPRDLIIASGETYSLREIIQKIMEQLNLKFSIDEIAEVSDQFIRQNEISYNSSNPQLAKNILNWKANIKIDELINRMLQYENWLINN